jgi:hypothetical protein
MDSGRRSSHAYRLGIAILQGGELQVRSYGLSGRYPRRPGSLASNTSVKTTRFNGAVNAMRCDGDYSVLAIVPSKVHLFSCA